jgi:hypothetical protein
MKLELKYLKSYLDTGLKCHCSGMYTADTEFDDEPHPQVFEIVGMNNIFVEIFQEGRTITEEMYFEDVFPILRPLSDLTKEIEVNGNKFVPIVELAKIGTGEVKCGVTNSNYGTCYIDAEFTKKGFFIFTQQTFIWQVGKNAEPRNIENQLELFEKLYEWHFDIYELIKKGLAIDINTL